MSLKNRNKQRKRMNRSLMVLIVLIPITWGVLTQIQSTHAFASTGNSQKTITGGALNIPYGIAVDGAGDLFVTSEYNNQIEELKSRSSTWTNITDSGLFSLPTGIAVNSAGDLFVTNGGNNKVLERKSGSSTWTNITSGGSFSSPTGIAVDSAGDLFVTNGGNNKILERKSGSSAWTNITNSGSFDHPQGIAVDSAGDLFVTNGKNNTIEERKSGSGAWTNITNSGPFDYPEGIAVDSAGDLFVTNDNSSTITELKSGTTTWTNVGVVASPTGIAVDSAGDLFVGNAWNKVIDELVAAYTITYNGNGDSGGTVPTDSNTYTSGMSATVPGNTGNLTKTGYAFAGWNTKADGSGTSYAAGSTLPMGASSVTLYAQWRVSLPPTPTSESVTVDGNAYQVIGNYGYNPEIAIEGGNYFGYAEERAALQAGASFTGEGMKSAYMTAILSGDGVGAEYKTHVTAEEQGQFVALYQQLGIISTWDGSNVTTPEEGIAKLKAAGASKLAMENYLVQLHGYSWSTAKEVAYNGLQ